MLFEQIESNKKKTLFIIVIFFVFLIGVGASASYYLLGNFVSGILLSIVFSIVYIPICISQGKKMVLKMNRAKRIEHASQYPHLWNAVEALSLVAKIPMPEIYIIEEESPNAFATGFTPKKSAVAVTTALLEKLNREEIEAVVAHEIAHIRNYDVRLTTISLALVAIIAVISDFATRILVLGDRENRNPLFLVIAILVLISAPIISLFLHFSLSRNREFLADAVGAELCRNPLALASALEKISNDPDPVDHISPSTAGIYFSEPLKKKKASLFATHPPVEDRIEKLRKM